MAVRSIGSCHRLTHSTNINSGLFTQSTRDYSFAVMIDRRLAIVITFNSAIRMRRLLAAGKPIYGIWTSTSIRMSEATRGFIRKYSAKPKFTASSGEQP